jgi:hypothetical protein
MPLTKYLQTRAIQGPWQISGCMEQGFMGAVVIPSLAESGHLFDTLRSLTANPPELLSRFLVLVVVNHREDGLPGDKEDNYQTLKQLAGADPELASLRFAWVDAASPGLEMPAKEGGVGLARKIGLDLALSRLRIPGTVYLIPLNFVYCPQNSPHGWQGFRFLLPLPGYLPPNHRNVHGYRQPMVARQLRHVLG